MIKNYGIYVLGIFLLLIVFVFGSYMKDLETLQTNIFTNLDLPAGKNVDFWHIEGESALKVVAIIEEEFSKDESINEGAVSMLSFGDLMLGRYVRTLMDQNGLYYPFEVIAPVGEDSFMHDYDIVMANLEGPIKEHYVPTSKSIAFRFKPDVVWEIQKAGIDIVSLANNHALDQGWGGREDSKKFLTEAGISYFGHPKNEVEDNVAYMIKGGRKFAFLGFDDTIFKINPEVAAEEIRRLDAENDYVIVSTHWGVEYVHTPTKRKVDLAHMYIDNGADLVIGHHPHVVQTMEIYNGVPIFYSLGNFVFDQYWSQPTQEGLAVGTEFSDEGLVLTLYPLKSVASQPMFMNEEESIMFIEKFITWGDFDEDFKNVIRSGKITLP